MTVREATKDDAQAICDFWNPQIEQTAVTFNSVLKDAAEVAEMIAKRPCFLVFEHGGAVVGFVTYDQFRGGIGYRNTMEHTIIVALEAAGQGAGRALMQAVLEHARARQVHSLWAGVSGENPAGVAFHKAMGFTQEAILPEVGLKFGRWMDLVLLQKRL